MDYKELVDKLRNNNIEDNCHDCALGYYAFEAATAITDLLSRAEAEEARCKILETRLETSEKMVKEYQEVIVPGYRERAEKAERELQIAVGGLAGQCKYCRKNQECTSRKGSHSYCWEWCGAKEE